MPSPDSQRARPRHVPASTYRIQLHQGFPLTAARDIVPYLKRLGIEGCYTSPYFCASPGSTHGYDVCNHNEINAELGGACAHEEFCQAVAGHGMQHIVDFVPNHMGIGTGTNPWWNDLLENGPSAAAAAFFDVDWTPVKAELQSKLLLPILGDQYGNVLDRGELQLAFNDGKLVLRYADQVLPVNPRQAPRVFNLAIAGVSETLGAGSAHVHEFLSILASLQNLPAYTEQEPERVAERQREKEIARSRLARLSAEVPAVREHIEQAVTAVNGTAGRPDSFNALHDLLEAQAYRLAYWRTASHEINYRRFFDVNTLAGLRVENCEVFDAIHQLLGAFIRDGKVHGVRVDHPDGLFDPARYFEMLQGLAARAWATAGTPPGGDLYVVAEKILSGPEQMPPRWRVHGTTGYNYLNDLNGIFVDLSKARRTRRVYAKLTGDADSFDDVLYKAKRLIMTTAMASELNVLGHMLDRIGEASRKSRDFTLDSMREVITEVVACFPVYRTYVDEGGWRSEDRLVVEQAVARARLRNPAMEASLYDFFREVVLPRDVQDTPQGPERRGGYPPADADEARERLRFAMKFQQYSGPVQAKGLEDTAFYRSNVLLSLNEVGGDPSRFGRSVEAFHEANLRRCAESPFEMLATSTHDTKLGEDARARINVISEMPEEWGREVSRWMRLNRAHKTIVDGDPAPDRIDEYRFYQALVAVWPADLPDDAAEAPRGLIDRLAAYMNKSVREAKIHTSWLTPNRPYEDALAHFIERTLAGSGAARLLAAFVPFQKQIARLGMINSLAQLTLKLGSPGVPDFYQGTDLWDLTLVDPDNRRPIDFSHRARLLDEVDAVLALDAPRRGEVIGGLVADWTDGRVKMLVTAAGLRLRNALPSLFAAGAYRPIATDVTVPAGAVAFARMGDVADGKCAGDAVLFAAPRLCAGMVSDEHPIPLGGEYWKTSRLYLPMELRDRTFRHAITGATIRPTHTGDAAWIFLGEAFQTLPVAIMTAE